MGIKLLAVEHTLDPALLELQQRPDAYRGHVPISLIFALVGVTLAIATNTSYAVVANEASASIPRQMAGFGAVNHQWSKSFYFEQNFQRFVHERIVTSVTYFSAVRELTSAGVAKLFARFPQYFEIFTSDNSVFRIDPRLRPNGRWGLDSPKSLSSFILLAPWLTEADLLRTFGRDYLDEPSLAKLFWELMGQEGEPPLDCVGTVEELVTSLNVAFQQGKFTRSHLVNLAKQRGVISDKDWSAALAPLLTLQAEQAIPEELRGSLNTLLQQGLSA